MITPFPDTRLVQEARELSARAHTPSLMQHSLRVFALGRELGRRKGLRFDEEGLLLASLFHDLGLSAPHRNPALAFPEVGAGLLQEFVSSRGEPARAAALAEAIDLHTQLFPRWSRSVESGLLHVANVIDVTGFRAKEVGDEFLREVQLTFPRLALDWEGPPAVLASIRSFRSVVRLFVPLKRSNNPALNATSITSGEPRPAP